MASASRAGGPVSAFAHGWSGELLIAHGRNHPMAQRRTTPKTQGKKATAAPTPQALVEEFFARCEALDLAGLGDYFTEGAVYHNMPLPAIRGKKRISAFLERGMKGLKGFEVEMIHIAAHGNVVLTERVDRIVFGEAAIALPVMG